MNKGREAFLLERALVRFAASTGMNGAVLPQGGKDASVADAIVELGIAGSATRYHAEVKPKVDRTAMLHALKAQAIHGHPPLLVTTQLSAELATRCRELDLQFIDTAGNAYLNNQKGMYIFVSGRREASPDLPRANRTTTPASLKVTFALFVRPQLMNAPFREIARAADVSLGIVGQVLASLQSRGFIGVDGSGKRAFLNRDQLIVDWATGYLNRLRPKLPSRCFAVPNPDDLMLYAPEPGVAVWGGEVAAARMTRYLKPSTFLLYKDPGANIITSLVSRYRLKADPGGQLEIVDAFWHGNELGLQQTAPAELVYADLIASQDPRNVETARILLDEVISDA